MTYQWHILVSRNYGYLSSDILVGSLRDEREANEEHICIRVGQRSQSVVVLLSCSVPQTKVNRLSVYHDVSGVVIEYIGDVLTGECTSGVADQQTRLANRSVGMECKL